MPFQVLNRFLYQTRSVPFCTKCLSNGLREEKIYFVDERAEREEKYFLVLRRRVSVKVLAKCSNSRENKTRFSINLDDVY